MPEPADDNIQPKAGFNWALWVVAGIGFSFAIAYAVAGCLMKTIC